MGLGSIAQPSRAMVSTRQGIAWGLEARQEDSSVLVLTSPKRSYVDIRYSLQGDPTSGSFWAFAGRVNYSSLSGLDGAPGVGIRGEWNHPIDSMGNSEGVDRADLFDLANGDQIEIGLLENPDTGKEDRFMEYWTSPTNNSTKEGTTNNVQCRVASSEKGGVLVGIAIMVGNHAQGIVHFEDGVKTTRWSRIEGLWTRDGRSNADEQSVPMTWLLENERLLGDKWSESGEWVISECD